MTNMGAPHVNEVLLEVEEHISKLDQCVAKIAMRMKITEECSQLAILAVEALDANKNATILSELRMLLMDQRSSEGGGALVPQSVLDMLEGGRDSCERYNRYLVD